MMFASLISLCCLIGSYSIIYSPALAMLNAESRLALLILVAPYLNNMFLYLSPAIQPLIPTSSCSLLDNVFVLEYIYIYICSELE
jgi:hypothetical protein